MLLSLLRTFTRPYVPWVVGVLVFQLAATIATLYLPSLNARIIDNGVARGDTDYIWRVGGVMLVVALVQVIAAVVIGGTSLSGGTSSREPSAKRGDALDSLALQLHDIGGRVAFDGPVRTVRRHRDNALVKQILATPGDGAAARASSWRSCPWP